MRDGSADHLGRWPANLCHDGSDEVVARFPDQESGGTPPFRPADNRRAAYGTFKGGEAAGIGGSAGSAARFFYSSKADSDDRGSKCRICGAVAAKAAEECRCTNPETGKADRLAHPTVKPTDLMRWLVRLVTPPGGTVLDPFMGTGSTGVACQCEQVDFIGCELSDDYAEIAEKRLGTSLGMFADVVVERPPERSAA
jgi:hypothetical protein